MNIEVKIPDAAGEAALKAVELSGPVIERGVRLVESLLGGPFKVSGQLLKDQIYAWQFANRLRILEKMEQRLHDRSIPRRCLPPGFLMPLLNACGDADDPSLADLWSKLLAGAIERDDAQHPVFIDIIRRMSGQDAALFERIGIEIGDPVTNVLFEWGFPLRERELLHSLYNLDSLGLVRQIGQHSEHDLRAPMMTLRPVGLRLLSYVQPDGHLGQFRDAEKFADAALHLH